MRILIQNPVGDSYFDGALWTGSMERAKDFGTVAQAEAFCSAQKLAGALIVVKFKNPDHDIRYAPNSRNILLVSKATTKIRSVA